jgi:hypothetical protein
MVGTSAIVEPVKKTVLARHSPDIIVLFLRYFASNLNMGDKMAAPAPLSLPRPVLPAHREAQRREFPEVVSALAEIIGRKLTAYIAGVKDVRAIARWLEGAAPYGDVEQRLRFAFQVAYMLAQHDSPRVVQAWLVGINPELGDRVPLRLLREGDLELVAPQILRAASAFIAGA